MLELPLGWAVPQIIAFMLVVARLSGLFLVAPVFSSPLIPVRIKISILAVLALVISSIVAPNGSDVPVGAVELLIAMLSESLIGLAIGFSVSIVFTAIQVAASYMDTAIGFAMATLVDPLNNSQGAVLGSFYTIMATLAFLAIQGHHWLIVAFKRSYDGVPIGTLPDVNLMIGNIMEIFVSLFAMAFQIAAPVLITLLLCDVMLGIVSRVVPQMNVFFVGVPMKIAVGMIAIIISLPAFLGFMEARVSDVLEGASLVANTNVAGEVKSPNG